MAGADAEGDVFVGAVGADAVAVAEDVGGAGYQGAEGRFGDVLGGIGRVGVDDGVISGGTGVGVWMGVSWGGVDVIVGLSS